ncbi:LysR family transcriptional regulator [Ruminococcus sp. OA3]|uniref:LysR family transcriptional regulator n=1 Tax=Ruminococcus sp. OA3 TaxID=2914164 RepID=UPI001F06A55F|nr:LysR family transcriptional regulator [Ruminococcus sp. OA3]MCH1984068.1 LysR family transcriptional regulator [Ruminococcus sp. OA3]
MIDLYILEHLVAFYEYGTLSAAAEKLHVSQPALSRSMQKLESLVNVPLFHHQKNKLTLNDTGIKATEYAKEILALEQNMIDQIRLYDRNTHTITFGSCAPVPESDFLNFAREAYPKKNISSEIKADEELLIGLENQKYLFVILHHIPNDETLFCKHYMDEQLYLNVPDAHPLAKRSSITFDEIGKQNLLLHTHIGIWYDLVREKLPDSSFMKVDEFNDLIQITGTGAFPSFATDISLQRIGNSPAHTAIPITDDCATVSYYFVCKKENSNQLCFLLFP